MMCRLRGTLNPFGIGPRVFLRRYILKALVEPIGQYGIRFLFEFVQVIDYEGSEEGIHVIKCRLIDDELRPFGPDPLHYALDGEMPEVVGIGLRGDFVDTYDDLLLHVTTMQDQIKRPSSRFPGVQGIRVFILLFFFVKGIYGTRLLLQRLVTFHPLHVIPGFDVP